MAVVTRPVVGLRSGPGTRRELVSQQLWGRGLAVLEKRGDWLRCEAADGMAQLRHAARRLRKTALARQVQSLLEQPEPSDWPSAYRTWHFAALRRGKSGALLLPMGSLLAVENVSGGVARVRAPDGSTGKIRAGALAGLKAGRVGPSKPPGPVKEIRECT